MSFPHTTFAFDSHLPTKKNPANKKIVQMQPSTSSKSTSSARATSPTSRPSSRPRTRRSPTSFGTSTRRRRGRTSSLPTRTRSSALDFLLVEEAKGGAGCVLWRVFKVRLASLTRNDQEGGHL